MIGLVLPLHLGSFGATVAVARHQPGATRRLIQLQAPGRSRIDILTLPLFVDIEVPAPIDLSVVAEAFVELPLSLEARGAIAPLGGRAAVQLRLLPSVEAVEPARPEGEARVWLAEVDTTVLLRAEMEARLRDIEELTLLEVL